MDKSTQTIAQLNDDLDHTESTIRMVYESCSDWLNDPIRESEADFVVGLMAVIANRHHLLVKDPEY